MDIRPFDPADADALWDLKRGFETGLGTGTGGDGKAEAYEAKLTADYRSRWLEWVERCTAERPDCVSVAARDAGARADDGGAVDGGTDSRGGADSGGADAAGGGDGGLAGYVFVLPESLAFVWDAAVLNEIYVAPDARGTGVADDLLDAALSVAREQDLPLDRLVLDVDRGNERARAFYERHGFTHWGEMVARDL